MSEQVKKTVVKERAENPDFAIAPLPPRGDLPARTDVEKYLEAKEGVAAKDRADFEEYLNQKRQRDALPPEAPPRPSKFDRRTMLKVVTGTAIAGETGALGYSWVKGSADQSAKQAGGVNTDPQRHPIVRELADSKADIGGRGLGKWILLLPTKLGGGTYAIDLNSNRVLGVHLVLELRRLQSDLPSPVRVPERRSLPLLRIRQQHPGRQEFADLRHSDPHPERPLRASTSIACATTARRWSFWKTCRKPPASGWAFT